MALALDAQLGDIVGTEYVGDTRDRVELEVDGLSPTAVVSPGSYEEVTRVLRYADDNSLAVIARGGGTMIQVGNPPRRYDLALDLSRLDSVLEYEPADLTVTCQSGITLTALQERLAEAGQTLPIGPAPDPRATIGGILAANYVGAFVLRYGRPRDTTIGMRLATPDGRLSRAGGFVVKNVAGYDLCKLYIGSRGTIGVIVEATFKVAPLPDAQEQMTVAMPGPEAAFLLASEIGRIALSARAIELELSDGGCFLTIDLAGSKGAVERSASKIGSLLPPLGGERLSNDRPLPATLDGTLVCRLALPPTCVPGVIERVSSVDPRAQIVAWPTVGVIYVVCKRTDEMGIINTLSTSLVPDASMIIERCSPKTKQMIDVFGEPPPSFPLMRAIKQQFDPNGILSPGRFVGRL